MLSFTVFVSLATLVASQATSQQLAVVEAEYTASKYDAAYPDGFDVPLKADALLTVTYGSTTLALGQPYPANAVSAMPSISSTPESSATAAFNASATYTVMLADANPLGNAAAQAQGQYRHYLKNGATFVAGSNGTYAIAGDTGTVVTSYAGPGPAAGEGPHRYAWLVFEQPPTFTPQANLTNAGSGPGHWFVHEYVTGTGLGPLVAASFFTVENGQASYSVVATSSVNTATVGGAGPTSSQSSTGASSSNSPTTSARPNGASTYAASGVLGFFAAVVAMAVA